MKTKLRVLASILYFFSFTVLSYSQAIKVNSDGKVGIGMDNPTAQLELKDQEFFMINAHDNQAGILFHETGDISSNSVQYGSFIEYDEDSDFFRFGTFHIGNKKYGMNFYRPSGHVGIGCKNTSWTYELKVNADAYITNTLKIGGDAWVNGDELVTSDKKVKKDIDNLDGAEILKKIQKIKGRKYKYKNRQELNNMLNSGKVLSSIGTVSGVDSNTVQNELIDIPHLPNGERYGLIAQEIQEEFPEAVSFDSTSMLYGINYNAFIPILLEAVKTQQKQIRKKELKINKDSLRINQLEDRLTKLEKEIQLMKAQCCNKNQRKKSGRLSEIVEPENADQSIQLYQNYPNPFDENTTIDYYLPKTTKNARFYIYNMSGNQIKSIPLKDTGNSSITIKGGELNPGMYMYTLIADGKEVDTKKMILTE